MAKDIDSVIRGIKTTLYRRLAAGDTDPTTSRKLRTLVNGCGWESRSQSRMESLATGLESAGLFSSIDIRPLGLSLDTTVRFAERPWSLKALIFPNEEELANYFSRNPQAIEAVLTDAGQLRHISGGHVPETEYDFNGEEVKPDLVFVGNDGTTIVVELELRGPKDNSLNQIERYVVAAEARQATPVRGLLITARPESDSFFEYVKQELKRLQVEHPNISWFCYDVAVSLDQVG